MACFQLLYHTYHRVPYNSQINAASQSQLSPVKDQSDVLVIVKDGYTTLCQ